MEEEREYLANIYVHIQYQQDVILHLTTRIQALEILLSSIPGYPDRHKDAAAEAADSEEIRGQRAALEALSLEIQRLRGGNLPIAEA